MGSLPYNKSLDGIRGLAILLVIFFHYGLLYFGWLGVQLFFVLSGYLITRILLLDRQRPLAAYLQRFYYRRTLRIFPLYYGALLVFTAGYWLAGQPELFGTDSLSLFTYTYNFKRVAGGPEIDRTYSHFWSLAVEEQFYLLWPLLVYFLPLRRFQALLGSLLVGLPLLRGAGALLVARGDVSQTWLVDVLYFTTFMQADAFAAGALVAACPLPFIAAPRKWFLLLLGLVVTLGVANQLQLQAPLGTALRTVGYPAMLDENYQYVYGYTLLNLLFALAVLASTRGQPLTSLLESRGLVFMGKISYGLYLLHVPVLEFMKPLLAGESGALARLGLFAGYFGVVLILAAISYYGFEMWFLRLKDGRKKARPAQPVGPEFAWTATPPVGVERTVGSLS